MILGPIAAGVGLIWVKPDQFRKILVSGVTLLVVACVVALGSLPLPVAGDSPSFEPHWLNTLMLVVEAGMGLYVVYVGLRARRPLIVALMLAQAGLMAWLEWTQGSKLAGGSELLRRQILSHHGPDQRRGGRRDMLIRAGLHAGIP